jgi:hypothetical protein
MKGAHVFMKLSLFYISIFSFSPVLFKFQKSIFNLIGNFGVIFNVWKSLDKLKKIQINFYSAFLYAIFSKYLLVLLALLMLKEHVRIVETTSWQQIWSSNIQNLEKAQLPKLTQEEIENLNVLIFIKEIELASLHTHKTSLGRNIFNNEFYHMPRK